MATGQSAASNQVRRPFFSVVIPVYNKAPHIRRCLSSVTGQAFHDFEAVLIDDASTDTSPDEIRRFEDRRIKLFSREQPRGGAAAARNLGIQKSQADWVAFLDADDEWHPAHLRNVFDAISRHPEAEIVTAGWRESLQGGVCNDDAYTRKHMSQGSHIWDIHTYVQGPRPICTSVAVIKRELLVRAGGFDEQLLHGEDTDLWLRLLLLHKCKAVWLAGVQAVYHRDSVNMVSANRVQTFSSSARTVRHFLKANPDISDDFKARLRKFANRISREMFFRNITGGTITRRDACATFYWSSLNLKNRLLLLALFVAPSKFKNFFMKRFDAD